MSYLQQGLPEPMPMPDGLDAPFWQGLRNEQICLPRCDACQRFQWGPEYICHRCHGFDFSYTAVEATGTIYSFERVWHPVHPALKEQGPYLVVLVELPQADGVRVVGNLLGPPEQQVQIGRAVHAVFEHHNDATHPFTLLQWET